MLRGTFHYSVRAEFSSIEGTVTIRKSRQYKVAIFWVRFYRVLWSWVDELWSWVESSTYQETEINR